MTKKLHRERERERERERDREREASLRKENETVFLREFAKRERDCFERDNERDENFSLYFYFHLP